MAQAATARPRSRTSGAARWPALSVFQFALLVSLLLHGLLLSIRFQPPARDPRVKDRGLEVVLVNARHSSRPDKPEALAQANLDGGGNTDQKVRAKSPLPAQNQDLRGDALMAAQRRVQQLESAQRELLTRARSTASVTVDPHKVEQPEPPRVSGLDLLDSAAAIARLEAQVDKRLEEYARRPRKRFIGARTQEYRFAQYVEDWRQKIERVGTLNYPEAARGKLYGSLLLSVLLRSDGSVESISVLRSSGHEVLDEAAARIVRMAAPFSAFPPEIRRDTDQIEITRTWTFTNADKVQAE